MHETFMKAAIDLARYGEGFVNPNPLVGAVIVRNREIIGTGYHACFGEKHAEAAAIQNAIKNGVTDFSDTELYVNLEPCCHTGKTPPCTDLIIKTGIGTVITGIKDPNPLVAGKGIHYLRNAGITVIEGVLEKECRNLNRIFIKFITTHRPYVLLKCASSLDGKIASLNGESKWISCQQSRNDSHTLRGIYSSIMCGINTVKNDDPLLTCRSGAKKNPIRIIVDTRLSIPYNSQIVKTAKDIPTIIATCAAHSSNQLEDAGITIFRTELHNGKVNLSTLMNHLGEKNIDSILIEGGGTLSFSAISSGIVDRVRFYIAPLIIGGENTKSSVSGTGFNSLAESCRLSELEATYCGQDIIMEGNICSQEL